MLRIRLMTLGLAASLLLVSATPIAAAQPSSEITVFAAASLTDAFRQIGGLYEYENPSTIVSFNFAGSNTLRSQLDLGARADVFASADQIQMEMASQQGDLSGPPQVFAHNQLTIITPANNPQNIQSVCDLGKPGVKFVTSQPTVPIGQYTQTVLANASAGACGAGFATSVASNTVSQESDVRQVVAKVQLGEADAGIVYTTDVTPAVRDDVTQIPIPAALNVVATYPIATAKGNNLDGGQQFVGYVLSPIGQAVLTHWGFLPADFSATSPSLALASFVPAVR